MGGATPSARGGGCRAAFSRRAGGAGRGPPPLPLLRGGVRCLAEPKMYIRNKAMSTGPHAPLVLVNGPKGRVANVNSGMCALGPGAPPAPNTVLGRALRLTLIN